MAEERATLSANALRRLAEEADGERDRHPVLVVEKDRDGEKVYLAFDGRPLKPNEQALIDLETVNDGPGLSKKPTIRLIVDGQEFGQGTGLDEADAVFTTQSALEKFLLPYYARVKTPKEINDLARSFFDDQFCIAVHHLPGTTPQADRYGKVSLKGGKLSFSLFSLTGPTRGNRDRSESDSTDDAGRLSYAAKGAQ